MIQGARTRRALWSPDLNAETSGLPVLSPKISRVIIVPSQHLSESV